MVDFDEVLPYIGENGLYQKLMLWFVLLPGTIPCGFNAYNQIFMAATPNHFCKIPELQYLLPEREELFKNISIPLEVLDGRARYSQCWMRDLNYSELILTGIETRNETPDSIPVIPCQNGWNYDLSQYEATVVTEWDLVCDKNIYPTIALVLLGVGGLVGNLIFGYVQDGLGRKPAFFIYLAIICIFGIATSYANDFVTWTIFRMGVGFTLPAIMSTPMVLALELVGTQYRTSVNIFLNIAYSLALVGLSGVVWLIRDWRTLSLATSTPFLLYFLYWFVMPESPRWLLSQGRFQKTKKILNQIAKINSKSLPQNYFSEIEHAQQNIPKRNRKEETTYGIKDLVRTPNLRRKTIIINFIWFATTSVYVGLSYYAPALGGDEFLNFFLAGVVELPTYLFLWPSMERWSRRWILCASMIIGGTACLATFLVTNDSVVTLGLYCVGKMGISSSFVVVLLLTSELYPTVIRGIGTGICCVSGGIGPIVIPLINYLGTDMLTLPLMIMGTLLILGGLSSLLLPETLHKPLPETLADGERTGLNHPQCYKTRQSKNKQCSNINESTI